METRNRRCSSTGLVVNLEQMEVRIGEKGWYTYQVIRHPGGVAVLPLHDDGTVTLIRQLRPAVDAVMLELPAGRLCPGEEPSVCGSTGACGRDRPGWRKAGFFLGRFTLPGVLDEVIHLYIATGLTQAETSQEDYEDIEPVRVPCRRSRGHGADGRITDAKTIVALFRAKGMSRP